MLNIKLQKRIITKRLNNMGIEGDLVDVHAHTDSTLTLSENWGNIEKKATHIKTKTIGQSGRIASASYSEQAAQIHANRSNKSKLMDDRKRAVNTFSPYDLTKKQFKKWKKQPNRYDIEEIDHFGF